MANYNYDAAPPPRISWTEGYTVNTGDFESLKLQLTVEDSLREGETVKQLEERLFNFVNKRIEAKVAQARRAFNGEG